MRKLTILIMLTFVALPILYGCSTRQLYTDRADYYGASANWEVHLIYRYTEEIKPTSPEECEHIHSLANEYTIRYLGKEKLQKIEYALYDNYNSRESMGSIDDASKTRTKPYVIKGSSQGGGRSTVPQKQLEGIRLTSEGWLPRNDGDIRLEISWNNKKEIIKLKVE